LQVYLTLCVALASSALGAYLHVVWNVGGMLTMLGCMGSIAWLFSVPVHEEVRLSSLKLTLIAPAVEI
jgi:Bax inhibitor 1